VADNVGLSRVDTARGTLMHRVELADDRVVSYVVVAPTERKFHPIGGFVSAVAKLHGSDGDELRREVSRWVVAYDPCVDWKMELRRA
jgi:coenzyme F420-reducing hydrogenase alpha subunit